MSVENDTFLKGEERAMPIITWNDDLSVGIMEIDGQHQKLVQMINDLHDAMRDGKSRAVLGGLIAGLADYADTHFATEEAYFDQYGYPEAGAHKREHAAFVQKVSEFKAGFDDGRLMLSMEVMTFLKDWLVNHIKGTDKRYTAFFQTKGLK